MEASRNQQSQHRVATPSTRRFHAVSKYPQSRVPSACDGGHHLRRRRRRRTRLCDLGGENPHTIQQLGSDHRPPSNDPQEPLGPPTAARRRWDGGLALSGVPRFATTSPTSPLAPLTEAPEERVLPLTTTVHAFRRPIEAGRDKSAGSQWATAWMNNANESLLAPLHPEQCDAVVAGTPPRLGSVMLTTYHTLHTPSRLHRPRNPHVWPFLPPSNRGLISLIAGTETTNS